MNELDEFFRSSDKYPVVLGVLSIILFGILSIIIFLRLKIKSLENQILKINYGKNI